MKGIKQYVKKKKRCKKQNLRARKKLKKRRIRDKKRRNMMHNHISSPKSNNSQLSIHQAPVDFRLLLNTKQCCAFFNRIRNGAKKNLLKGIYQVIVSFQETIYIDFASIQVLNAIGEELLAGTPSCVMRGLLPKAPKIRQYLIDSGFLEGKVNEYGSQFSPSKSTSKMKIKVGQLVWTDDDGENAVKIIEKTQRHLQGATIPTYISVNIKEICGNSVEWGNSMHKQWVLAAKFEYNRVEYVALDLGDGILKTIRRDFWQRIAELGFTTDKEILWNAFDKKYFSHSGDPNRHKGLPQIKWEFMRGRFKELYVLSNSVLLNFENENKSICMGKNGFGGTLYRWVITKECMAINQI